MSFGESAARPPHGWLWLWYDARARSALLQILFVAGFAALAVAAFVDVRAHMQARGIPTDFSFLGNVAGFDINQSLIPYSAASTYGRAFLVGLLNTCLVGALGLMFATIIGFSVGLARLSKNWIVARCAMAYVEGLRNVPLLLQLLFWYNAVLKPLPAPRQSFELPFGVFLNNRGLFVPEPVSQPGALWVVIAALVSLVAAIGLRWLAIRRKFASPRAAFFSGVAAAFVVVLPIAAFVGAGEPDNIRAAGAAGIQLQRRRPAAARIRRAGSGPQPLHGGLHRGDRAGGRRGRAARSARGGGGARPHGVAGEPPRRAAAGDAPHRPLVDQPISEPHQEFIARRVHRLSRSRAGLRRNGAEPDRRRRAGDLHHDGCVSC